MKLLIETADLSLANDLADVARIFFGQLVYTAVEPGGGADKDEDIRLCMTELLTDTGMQMIVHAEGAISGDAAYMYTPCGEKLEDKRLRKRAAKLAVYRIFRDASGRQPPWGALTGIRPTRLVYQRMEHGDNLNQALSWLRETFDLTESRISLLREIVLVQKTLPPVKPNGVELYIGIPFCVTRCAYCSFSSGELGDGRLVRPYTDALLHEIEGVKMLIARRGLEVSTVYMGGGTPTSLPVSEMERLMKAISPLAEGREFTVEAGRPDTIDEEKLRLLKSSGVTRISVNPQTFHDETLERIGRRHTSAQTVEAFELARKLGFDDINMDLIAGLPGEDEELFSRSLKRIRMLRPDSMTVHSLAIKHASALHLYGAPLPDGVMTARMLDDARTCAAEMGLSPYYMYRQKYMAGALENVAYALPGRECLYNVRMMEETGHIIALGAGGISKRVAPSGGKIVRAPNVGNIEEYIRRVDEMLERKNHLWEEAFAAADCQAPEKVL